MPIHSPASLDVPPAHGPSIVLRGLQETYQLVSETQRLLDMMAHQLNDDAVEAEPEGVPAIMETDNDDVGVVTLAQPVLAIPLGPHAQAVEELQLAVTEMEARVAMMEAEMKEIKELVELFERRLDRLEELAEERVRMANLRMKSLDGDEEVVRGDREHEVDNAAGSM